MKSSVNWGDAYYDHYLKFLGTHQFRKIFRQSETSPTIQIFRFDDVFQGCKAFASFGASNYASAIGRRAEVILTCDSGWDAAADILANSLFYLIQNRVTIGRGVCVGGLDQTHPDFVREFKKTAVYFTNPFGFPEAFPVVYNGDEKGRVYLAIFISQTEDDFFCDRGAVEFETLLEKSGVDPFHLNRRSVV